MANAAAKLQKRLDSAIPLVAQQATLELLKGISYTTQPSSAFEAAFAAFLKHSNEHVVDEAVTKLVTLSSSGSLPVDVAIELVKGAVGTCGDVGASSLVDGLSKLVQVAALQGALPPPSGPWLSHPLACILQERPDLASQLLGAADSVLRAACREQQLVNSGGAYRAWLWLKPLFSVVMQEGVILPALQAQGTGAALTCQLASQLADLALLAFEVGCSAPDQQSGSDKQTNKSGGATLSRSKLATDEEGGEGVCLCGRILDFLMSHLTVMPLATAADSMVVVHCAAALTAAMVQCWEEACCSRQLQVGRGVESRAQRCALLLLQLYRNMHVRGGGAAAHQLLSHLMALTEGVPAAAEQLPPCLAATAAKAHSKDSLQSAKSQHHNSGQDGSLALFPPQYFKIEPGDSAPQDCSDFDDSSSDCSDESSQKRTRSVNRWSKEEHEMLKKWVHKYGTERKWSAISSLIPGRTGKQCRERWMNHLRPDIKKGSWTVDEEYEIAKQHSNVGSQWSRIARSLPGRTENNIKNHWNALYRSKGLLNRSTGVLGTYMKLLKTGVQPQEAFVDAVRCVSEKEQNQEELAAPHGKRKYPQKRARAKPKVESRDHSGRDGSQNCGTSSTTGDVNEASISASKDSGGSKQESQTSVPVLAFAKGLDLDLPCHLDDAMAQMAFSGEGALSLLRQKQAAEQSRNVCGSRQSQYSVEAMLAIEDATDLYTNYSSAWMEGLIPPWDAVDMVDEAELADALETQYGPNFASGPASAMPSGSTAVPPSRLQGIQLQRADVPRLNSVTADAAAAGKAGSLPTSFWNCASSLKQRSTGLVSNLFRMLNGNQGSCASGAARWSHSMPVMDSSGMHSGGNGNGYVQREAQLGSFSNYSTSPNAEACPALSLSSFTVPPDAGAVSMRMIGVASAFEPQRPSTSPWSWGNSGQWSWGNSNNQWH